MKVISSLGWEPRLATEKPLPLGLYRLFYDDTPFTSFGPIPNCLQWQQKPRGEITIAQPRQAKQLMNEKYEFITRKYLYNSFTRFLSCGIASFYFGG